jgi:hypothetical protein
MKCDPGPPMTLANAAAARVRLIAWCLPFGSHRASPGVWFAAIRLSLIPPKWRDDTAPRLPFPIGVGAYLFALREPPKASRPSGEATNRYGGDPH